MNIINKLDICIAPLSKILLKGAQSYALLKRNVLRFPLKDSRVSTDLKPSGRLFHRWEPAFENDLSPYDVRVTGTSTVRLDADLKALLGLYGVTSSWM